MYCWATKVLMNGVLRRGSTLLFDEHPTCRDSENVIHLGLLDSQKQLFFSVSLCILYTIRKSTSCYEKGYLHLSTYRKIANTFTHFFRGFYQMSSLKKVLRYFTGINCSFLEILRGCLVNSTFVFIWVIGSLYTTLQQSK